MTTPEPLYDRQLLLAGPKRHEVLELWEVQRYGTDSYGDPDYVSIYGMRPADWYAKGVRLLGRTAVECTRDPLAKAIAEDVAAIAQTAPANSGLWILDPFAGSANTLYWLLHGLEGRPKASNHADAAPPGQSVDRSSAAVRGGFGLLAELLADARGFGCELDTNLFQLTTRNLKTIESPIQIVNTDYRTGIANVPVRTDQLLVTFIAPPWGDALNPQSGLDLRRTAPPISEIVDFLIHTFGRNKLLCAIQVYEKVDPASLAELKPRFDWSIEHMYALNKPGQNHGILLATRGWSPQTP